MSDRALITLPLSQEIKKKLLDVGFKYRCDIEGFNSHTLALALRLSPDECEDIIRIVQLIKVPKIEPLKDVLREEFKDSRIQKIKTSCQSLDRKLNGGIPIGNVIELYGTGGAGKTQFCYQLCVNVQTPASMKGLDGEVLYIDTESRLKTERILEIAKCFSQDVLNQEDFDENSFLDKIHLVRVSRPEKLRMLILHHLDAFLEKHPKVKLVILDSVTYQMRFSRPDVEIDYRTRTKEIHLIAHKLRIIAHKRRVAVVITNQVTKKIETAELQPALGKTWSFTCSTKLFLQRLNDDCGTRKVTLVKSRLKGPFTALFQIKSCGVVQTSVDQLSQSIDE